jgi:protein-S-isoprenylcysteine O-methyltransferase Ste14
MNRALRSAITFLIGSAFFVLLPIAGWGISDIPGLFHNSGRLAFFALVCLLNAFAAIRIPEIGKVRDEQRTMIKRQHLAVIFFQVLSITLVIVAPFCDRRNIATMDDGEGVRYLGLGLYTVGFLAMHFSEWYLGRHFSVEVAIQEEHTLVTDGPYRYLRHPRYSGMILFITGIALAFRSWIGLGLAAVTTVILFWRIHDEEALMQQEFGTRWEEYARTRRRLIPFVY